jgi:CubicO group peptidase (beta-lactamase class C family)
MTDKSTTPDGAFAAALDGVDVSGLTVAIFDRTGLLWSTARGVRDAGSGAPVDLSTWFPLGAITQTFTAMAVLHLRDAGALSLDDPLSRHVPEASGFRYPTKDSPPVTLRHLLTHTSGLPPGARELRKLLGHDPSDVELLAHVCSQEMAFVPGTAGRHSDLGFALLGIAIERVSGAEVSDFIARRLLGPMGLQATSFQPAGPLAVPHRRADDGAFRPRSRPRVPEPAYRAASGLHGTVTDLCTHGAAHLSAWPPRDEGEPGVPLRRATLREAHRPAGFHRVGRNSQGLGWLIERDPVVGDVVFRDGASLSGTSSFLGFEPDVGIGAAALANVDIDLKEPLFDLMGRYKVAHGLLEDWRR